MSAYYNEIDPYAAEWLRNLILLGAIAPGDVDTRSIVDVRPDDLRGYTQCHFFAGIGVWSHALRLAAWPDDRAIWTGSCPCQPFSAAGAGAGFADERHLWPHFHHLIAECRPAIVVGEQVASKVADAWVDLVQADLEALDYAFGAVAFPSAGVGAPHIRDRTYWMADSHNSGRIGRRPGEASDGRNAARVEPERLRYAGGLADNQLQQRPNGQRGIGLFDEARGRQQGAAALAGLRSAGGLVDAQSSGRQGESIRAAARGPTFGVAQGSDISGLAHPDSAITEQPTGEWARPGEAPGRWPHNQLDGRGELAQGQPATGPTNGFWRDADWLGCRDGKWRPVEPGTFPLAHGAAARVGRLRAYGNAINSQAAKAFIEVLMEAAP